MRLDAVFRDPRPPFFGFPVKKSYDQFIALLIGIVITVWAVFALKTPRLNKPIKASPLLFRADDAETVFAFGLRLPLACADLWSLEQIPNLSSRVAERLVTHRSEILRNARALGPKQALQNVYGVGKATAGRLLTYLDPSTDCIQDRAFLTPFTLSTDGHRESASP
jgi:hypothetical protein